MAEYTISQQKIKIGTTSDKVANDALQVQISWIIFNGDASFRRVQPRNPVTFESLNAAGAIQLVTRYSELNLDAKAFTHGLFNPDRSVSRAQDFGVGINWYLNHNIKLQLSYNQTHFTHGAVARFDRPTEKSYSHVCKSRSNRQLPEIEKQWVEMPLLGPRALKLLFHRILLFEAKFIAANLYY